MLQRRAHIPKGSKYRHNPCAQPKVRISTMKLRGAFGTLEICQVSPQSNGAPRPRSPDPMCKDLAAELGLLRCPIKVRMMVTMWTLSIRIDICTYCDYRDPAT